MGSDHDEISAAAGKGLGTQTAVLCSHETPEQIIAAIFPTNPTRGALAGKVDFLQQK